MGLQPPAKYGDAAGNGSWSEGSGGGRRGRRKGVSGEARSSLAFWTCI